MILQAPTNAGSFQFSSGNTVQANGGLISTATLADAVDAMRSGCTPVAFPSVLVFQNPAGTQGLVLLHHLH